LPLAGCAIVVLTDGTLVVFVLVMVYFTDETAPALK